MASVTRARSRIRLMCTLAPKEAPRPRWNQGRECRVSLPSTHPPSWPTHPSIRPALQHLLQPPAAAVHHGAGQPQETQVEGNVGRDTLETWRPDSPSILDPTCSSSSAELSSTSLVFLFHKMHALFKFHFSSSVVSIFSFSPIFVTKHYSSLCSYLY